MHNDITLYFLKVFAHWIIEKTKDFGFWIKNNTGLTITIIYLLVGAIIGYFIYIPAMGFAIIGILVIIYLFLFLLYLIVAAIIAATDSDIDLIELWLD